MKGYMIYLTRSPEAARAISNGYEVGKNGIESVGHGAIMGQNHIPKIYHNAGYFQCTIIYQDSKIDRYSLIFC